jgi:hypothetical protein
MVLRTWSASRPYMIPTNGMAAAARSRLIMEGGEGPFVLALGVVWLSPVLAGGVVSQAPIRRPAMKSAGAMTMCSGTGLLSKMIERGRWPAHAAQVSVPRAR